MPSTLLRRLLGILGAMALSSGALGCSFSITPEAVEPPPTKISTVAIGSIEAADPDRQRIVRRFRRALAAGLEDSEAFSRVLSTAPAQLPADAVLVTGRFLEVKDGPEALRFLVGYGVGSPTLRARFEISDLAGRVLASFEEDARSFDGTGYAARWNPVDTDDLADGFAVETAEAIARWSRGEELDLSIW
ncbi:MAG: DUF4410 domain-containing protein [Bacteroidota bacterium]